MQKRKAIKEAFPVFQNWAKPTVDFFGQPWTRSINRSSLTDGHDRKLDGNPNIDTKFLALCLREYHQ